MRCAVALSAIAARADEHLSLTPRTQKQPGIVHRSPRRRGLDDPTSPGNTGLGAVRQCGSVAQPRTLTAKSLRSEAASVSSPSPISLQPLNDVTLAHEATALCDQHHRFAGETTASQRRGRGAASEHVRPRRRIRLRRAVRRISALLRSHQQPKDKKGLKESYEHLDGDPKATLEQVVEFVHGCYEQPVSRLHRNARMFLEWRYGNEMPFDAQLRRVWITEARLCSIAKTTEDPGPEAYKRCEDKYLVRQIERLPRAQVVAFGKKAERTVENLWRTGRLREKPIIAGSLASYGNRLTPARESWKVALRQLRPPKP